MRKQLILKVFILVGLFSCNGQKKLDHVIEIIAEVENEFAPDSRTAIFDIKPENFNPITLAGETNLVAAKSSLFDRFKSNQISVVDKIVILPDESVGSKKYALINISVAPLRTSPKHSAELATQAILGTPVNVLKKENGWYLVQTPDHYIAWTNSGSLTLMDQKQYLKWKNDPKIVYLNTYGFSMNEAGTQRVSDLVSGNILALDHETENYFAVIYPDGRKANINKNEAEILKNWCNKITVSDSSVSYTANDLMGIPYLWGGTSTKGLDCSGFTKTVYFLNGLILPRDASQQVHVGKLVDKDKVFSKLQVGDLLFFGRKNDDQTEKVIHVGMWLGNNQFIHASGDVHISSMDSLAENFDDYNFNRYLRTKRIIGENLDMVPEIKNIY